VLALTVKAKAPLTVPPKLAAVLAEIVVAAVSTMAEVDGLSVTELALEVSVAPVVILPADVVALITPEVEILFANANKLVDENVTLVNGVTPPMTPPSVMVAEVTFKLCAPLTVFVKFVVPEEVMVKSAPRIKAVLKVTALKGVVPQEPLGVTVAALTVNAKAPSTVPPNVAVVLAVTVVAAPRIMALVLGLKLTGPPLAL
jgi:hypothetical protein